MHSTQYLSGFNKTLLMIIMTTIICVVVNKMENQMNYENRIISIFLTWLLRLLSAEKCNFVVVQLVTVSIPKRINDLIVLLYACVS